MKLGPITRTREIRHAHLFCGIGGGARGFNRAAPRVGNVQARFVCAGGIDVDPGAIRNFEIQTGAKGTVIGPGSLSVAHKPDEFVPIDEFVASSLIYCDVAKAMLGGGH